MSGSLVFKSSPVVDDPISTQYDLVSSGSPITVPDSFMMIHHGDTYETLQGLSASIDTLQFGMFRTHDNSATRWNNIETSDNVFSWTATDALINAYYARGIKVMFTIFGTPKFHVKGIPWTALEVVPLASNVADGSLGYRHPTVNNARRYKCITAGTCGATEPTWPATTYFTGFTASWSAGTATINTSGSHGLTTGDVIVVTGVTPSGYNGTYTLLSGSGTTFTYAIASDPGSFVSTGIYYTTVLDGTVRWQTNDLETNIYGTTGLASNPYLDKLSRFVTELTTRYIGKIHYIEVWNEPSFWDGTSGKPGNGFFKGYAYHLVDMALTIRTAAKAVDPTLKIIGCGFSHAPTYDWTHAQLFLTTDSIDVDISKKGRDALDEISWHRYGGTTKMLDSRNWYDGTYVSVQGVKALLTAAGMSTSTPQHLSEWGMFNSLGTGGNDILALSTSERRDLAIIDMIFMAAIGLQSVGWYVYGHRTGGTLDSTFCGDMIGDTVDNIYGIRGGVNIAQGLIAGKTIEECTYYIYVSGTHRIRVKIAGRDYWYQLPAGVPY